MTLVERLRNVAREWNHVVPAARVIVLQEAADRIDALEVELNEAAEATGIAGVDKPLSLLDAIKTLKANRDRFAAKGKALREALNETISAHDGYRARGVVPAPDEYQRMVQAINAARAPGLAPCERPPLQGTWPADDIRRVFVEGAAWWEWYTTKATMWASDRTLAEAEAEQQYPGGLAPSREGA